MELAAGARAWIRLRPTVLAPFPAAGVKPAGGDALCAWPTSQGPLCSRPFPRLVSSPQVVTRRVPGLRPRPTVLAPFPAAGVKPAGMDGGAS
ncbi:hypothetical protein CHLRE_23g754647v5 [Chlamydomonas reinhardtii]|uniref:Uncharacterized protein n=1 Tax=Chlamydomonas reinhardtii TaxID=3055 RepID=A0A2K3CN54_CHLRE|nr:uncharacterized protein CHLRE_23g754647v5 [Chlamydomonas reinhardtii]PNW69714.1 hypothetical protein CHLRE_23g754647v5 [Chlamydomonas reinhardtii]